MKSITKTLVTLALTVAVGPVYAQTSETITHTTDTTSPPQVLDSWMQPAGYKTVEKQDQNGETKTTQEPVIFERHEKVMVPVTHEEDTTVITKTPAKTVTNVATVSHAITIKKKPVYRHRVATVHRTLASHPRTSQVAYKAAKSTAITTVQTPSTTVIEHNERSVEKPVVLEQRDPALNNN